MNLILKRPKGHDPAKPWITVLFAINPWLQATKVVRFPFGWHRDLEVALNHIKQLHLEFPRNRYRLVELRLSCQMINNNPGVVKHRIIKEETLRVYKNGKIKSYKDRN